MLILPIIKQEVAHFLMKKLAEYFLLYRTTTHIQLSIHGRNEVPNMCSGRIRKKIRNLIFALLAVAGISKFNGNHWHMDCYIFLIKSKMKNIYILLYDGDCGFCNHWVRWVLDNNHKVA